ncbi:MAG: hypothetical protein DMF03_07545 [Verrucomicrobia bacterium]|nr:MAG: hypothetical protein DMF03_07545 [Verrucomicrobiota bacterium]
MIRITVKAVSALNERSTFSPSQSFRADKVCGRTIAPRALAGLTLARPLWRWIILFWDACRFGHADEGF